MMKKKILLLFLLFSLGTLHGLAQYFEFTASGITWKCSVTSDETVSIHGANSETPVASQELVIPTTVSDASGNAYTVTDLTWNSGLEPDLSKVTKVVLPKSLISLGGGTFSGCSKLATVENTENIQRISSAAFSKCTSLAGITLPNCTFVGTSAFYECTNLTTIELPQCTSIGTEAFSNCFGLTSAVFPKCTTIRDRAFTNCSNLTSADFPLCSSIGQRAFNYCSNLSSINLPLCTSIGDAAFASCSNLSSINIPECITLGQQSFSGCPIQSATLPSSLTRLGAGCFGDYIYLTINATTPPTITELSADASLFNGKCYVKVPDSSLDAYRSADGWKTIAKQIFAMSEESYYDVNVTAQESTSGLSEAIGKDNLQKVLRLKVSGTINGYDIMVIRNKMDNLYYLDLADAEIVDNAYEYYTGCATKHKEIGAHAFDGLSKLSEITLPKDITRIGQNAFNGCNGLRYISLPSKVKEIGYGAFWNCI